MSHKSEKSNKTLKNINALIIRVCLIQFILIFLKSAGLLNTWPTIAVIWPILALIIFLAALIMIGIFGLLIEDMSVKHD